MNSHDIIALPSMHFIADITLPYKLILHDYKAR